MPVNSFQDYYRTLANQNYNLEKAQYSADDFYQSHKPYESTLETSSISSKRIPGFHDISTDRLTAKEILAGESYHDMSQFNTDRKVDTFNQSLFMDNPPGLGTVLDRQIDLLDEENKVLKETVEKYKGMFYGVVEKATLAINKMKNELLEINEKIERLKKIPVAQKEHDRVLNLVRNMFYESKKASSTKFPVLYDEFKEIMLKYSIKIE